ncbi:MAG: twin-arginine translocation signal domain-containing protein [Planctomycetaceae bacterium]|nr:twin-arginine translocation signal domain-containing protein [Planctomycetaceae bacterium]
MHSDKVSRRTFFKSSGLAAAGAVLATQVSPITAQTLAPSRLKIVTFKVDVTPPVGEPLAYDPNEKVETPIYVSGIVLDDGNTRAVWVSCDYLYICGESYDVWTEMIATQAGTVKENVFHHSVHQHDSIRWAPEYNPKPGEEGPLVVSPEYCAKSLKDVSEAIAKAVSGQWQTVGKLLTAETRVGGLAANRRLVDENGQFAHTRYSGRNTPAIQAFPVGKIDPMLRTVCFENTAGQRMVALHFYATHPMAAYRRKMVSTDVPGRALRQVTENDDSVALNIYFSGCGGDITFGKYNLTGDIHAIEQLGKRLGEGMLQNLRRLEEQPLGSIDVKRVAVEIPFSPSIQPASVYSGEHALERRYQMETLDRWRQSSVARMSLGSRVHFLSFAFGEVFVDYQLYAQSLIPEHFLATAAFGNGVYWYIPTAAAFAENGGYETSDQACIVTPEIDGFLRESLRQCLAEVVNGPHVF